MDWPNIWKYILFNSFALTMWSEVSIQKELTIEKLEAAIERYYPVKTRSPAQQEQTNIFCSDHSVVMPSLQDVQPYTALNPSMSLEGNLSSEQVEKDQRGLHHLSDFPAIVPDNSHHT